MINIQPRCCMPGWHMTRPRVPVSPQLLVTRTCKLFANPQFASLLAAAARVTRGGQSAARRVRAVCFLQMLGR